ncbi:MAG: PD-(D/E)XK nuclease domain-containing protein, partial [Lachnospiraceae bacterium]|nr:PD-(D/E)XK nuclease domain-containing protein [Lachnospiraceae bacterium]
SMLLESISYYDYAENYYHGFMTGLLSGSNKYRVLSNRESGNGRPDLIMKAGSRRGMAFVFEFKIADAFQKLEAGCEEALEQIEKQNYETELRNEGYQHIRKYAICFFGKDCLVMESK